MPFLCALAILSLAQPTLNLPARPHDALAGDAFARQIEDLPVKDREERIIEEVDKGNVPMFLRTLVPVDLQLLSGTTAIYGRIFVTPDYLAIGSDDDYLLMPMTPHTAQRIADLLDCSLPTPRMVDAIFTAAKLKLEPRPIPPSPAMITVQVFQQHARLVNAQRKESLNEWPLGSLMAGDKKDIVICRELSSSPGRVAIYGWHHPDGTPIQPLYVKHLASWADYSHGVRLISQSMEVDGKPRRLQDVLKDPVLSGLVSGEGPLTQTRYLLDESH